MLSVNQTAKIISTYTGDTSGVCSALFELGGMTVMHDPSGCNSTYNTHDEPRWYDSDSLVFISALTEAQAIMGDDEKLFSDTLDAALELKPNFIALAGSPIPMLIGVDFDAVAYRLESTTDIPSFGFATDGMHSYVSGASMAFKRLAERICVEKVKSEGISVNLLGVTPLDFSVVGNVEDMRTALENGGIKINGCWAMGGDIRDIKNAALAHVNLVVSSCGLEAAKVLEKRFGIPYVIGTPCGEKITEYIIEIIKLSSQSGQSYNAFDLFYGISSSNLLKNGISEPNYELKQSSKQIEESIIKINNIVSQSGRINNISSTDLKAVIIGESVTARSLAVALEIERGISTRVICPVELPNELRSEKCIKATDEDDIIPLIKNADIVIADPLYKPIVPPSAKFVALPHEAFSGRIYRNKIPRLVFGLNTFLKENDL